MTHELTCQHQFVQCQLALRETKKSTFYQGYLLSYITAEKVSSLGKDWHRPCLRCDKCKKTLSSGSHAEVIWTVIFIVYQTVADNATLL